MNDMLDAENAAQDPTNTLAPSSKSVGDGDPMFVSSPVHEYPLPPSVDAGPSLKRKSEVVYRALQGRKWRTAVVWTAYRCGRVVKILYTKNGKQFFAEDVMVKLVNQPLEVLSIEEVNERIPHWAALHSDLQLRLSKDHNPGDDLTVDHMPLYIFMQRKNYKANPISKGTLRLGTFNIKHYGAKKSCTGCTARRTRAGCPIASPFASPCEYCSEIKRHEDERTRNLVEVIHQARCSVVALQEIATSADTALLCSLLDERHREDYGESGKDERVMVQHRNHWRARHDLPTCAARLLLGIS
jgi:hypothetical protein